MTQKIAIANIPVERVTAAGSRYRDKQNVIYYGDRNLVTYDTYIRRTYTPSGQEDVMVITKGVEYRPDLVSYDYYGFSEHWWRIMEVNKIYDIYDFKAGRTIILPPVGQ